MDLSTYTFPVWLIIILTGAACYATAWMVAKGHYKILFPVSMSFFWIMLSYVAFNTGFIDSDDKNAMIRDGIAVMSIAVIVGAILFRDWLKNHAKH